MQTNYVDANLMERVFTVSGKVIVAWWTSAAVQARQPRRAYPTLVCTSLHCQHGQLTGSKSLVFSNKHFQYRETSSVVTLGQRS
jgi:hypothetical protein